MEKSEIKGFIAKRCAKELKDGDVVNLGIGLPTLIPHYLPEGVELALIPLVEPLDAASESLISAGTVHIPAAERATFQKE